MSIPSHFPPMDLVSCLAHRTTPFVCGMRRQAMPLGSLSRVIPALSNPSHFHPMDLVSCLAHLTTPFVSGTQRCLTLSPHWVPELILNFYHLVGRLIRRLRSYFGFHRGLGRVYVSLEIRWPFHEMDPPPSSILASSNTGRLGRNAGQIKLLVYSFFPSGAFKSYYVCSVTLDIPTLIAMFTGWWYHWNTI